jgi:hypothetical protein
VAISDDDKANLADLSMRALDTILEDYGEDAELIGASLVFEVRVPSDDPDDDWAYHGNYKSMRGMSPQHVGGMHQSMAYWLLANFSGGD